MLIILHGENSFFSKRKLDEIIAQYKAKHQGALSFFVFDESSNISDIKAAYDTISLFEKKKLIVLKNIFTTKQYSAFGAFFKRKKAKAEKDTVVLFYEQNKINSNKENTWFFEKPSMVQESKKLMSGALSDWVIFEVSKHKGNISYGDANFLVNRCGNNMWQLSNEIIKLVSYNKTITKQNIIRLISEYDDNASNVFYGVDALLEGNITTSVRHFYSLLQQGERWDKMMGAMVFQFRNMILVSDVLRKNISRAECIKKLKMKVFVFNKTSQQIKKYTPATLRRVYLFLLKIDMALKTGKTTFENALLQLHAELSA